jgi:hypothetical protein
VPESRVDPMSGAASRSSLVPLSRWNSPSGGSFRKPRFGSLVLRSYEKAPDRLRVNSSFDANSL